MTDELSGAVARGVRDALIAAHHATVDNHHEKADAARTDFMERMERELADVFKEMGLVDFNDPRLSDDVRQAWSSIIEPTHQSNFFFNLLATLGVALSGAFAAAAGVNQQLTERGLNLNADIKPDAGTTAAMLAAGYISDGTATTWMNDVGAKKAVVVAYKQAAESWPALGEVLALAHRGMNASEVDIMLKHNGYADTTIDLLKKYLLEGPPSSEAAITGRLKGHLDDAQAGAILAANGIDPTNLGWLRATAGRPPGIQELMTLWRRGKIDQAHLEGAIRQSDINDDYLPDILNLRYHSLPFRSVVSAFTKGNIDEPTARLWLDWVGILPEQIDAVIKTAAHTATSATKHLSAQQYVALYESQLWTRDQALAALEAINYPAGEANLEIDLADHRKIVAAQTRSANQVGTRYVGWKIDRNTASQALDALQVPAAARDSMLTDWDLVRETRTAHLTRPDIHKAVNAQKMTSVEGIARLRAMGYDAADADLIPFIDKWA